MDICQHQPESEYDAWLELEHKDEFAALGGVIKQLQTAISMIQSEEAADAVTVEVILWSWCFRQPQMKIMPHTPLVVEDDCSQSWNRFATDQAAV